MTREALGANIPVVASSTSPPRTIPRRSVMADITVADFRARFPEFSAVADDDVGQYIETAYILSDVSREATYYTAAHLGSLDDAERSATAIAPLTTGAAPSSRNRLAPRNSNSCNRRWTAARSSTPAQSTGGWRWPLRTARLRP